MVLLTAAVCAAPCAGRGHAAIHSFIRDGGFEQSSPSAISLRWVAHGLAQVARDLRHRGANSLRIGADSLAEQNILAVAPGEWYACSGWMRTRDVRPTDGAGHAYLAIYQYDDYDNLLAYHDFAGVTGTTDWTRYTYVFQVNAAATRVSLRAGLWQAAGEAWVDDLTLVAGREPTEWEPAMDASASRSAGQSGAACVAILRDDFPVVGAPSSPERLAALLRRAGIDTAFVNAQQLADPSVFNRAAFDLVVLPYGPTFPLQAHRAFQQFLAEGGDFISMGGYAFDNLVERLAAGWVTQEQALAMQQEPVPIGGDFESGGWDGETPDAGSPTARFPGPLKGRGKAAKPSAAVAAGRACLATCLAPKGRKPRAIATCAVVSDVAHSGKRSLRTQAPPGTLDARCYRDVAAQPGQEYIFSGWIKAGALPREKDGFAFLAVYQYGAGDRLVKFRDIAQVTARQDWRRYEWRFQVAADVTRLRLIAGLYNTSGTAWFDDIALVRVPPRMVMNTRSGVPLDALQVGALQIGAFDPSYVLERAAYARGNDDGFIVSSSAALAGPFEGYAASGVVGWNQARWVSLINSYDRYGRLRGSIGALLRNYAGVYARSSWAFFGVTNRDLFAPGQAKMGEAFVRLVRSMLAETYLHNLATDRACYKQGEEVKVTAQVSNFGRQAAALTVGVQLLPARMPTPPPPLPAPPLIKIGVLAPGETKAVEHSWRVTGPYHDFARVIVTLYHDGAAIDRMETAFAVYDDRALAAGPAVDFKGNYIEAGGARHFLLGTDCYGNMFGAAAQNPLTWARDLGAMRDNGITVYENLQFDPARFMPPYVPGEQVARQVRAMVQLAQLRRLIYMPGLLIGYNTAVGDAELKQQASWCEAFARMFAQTPGIVYYTNGDLQMSPHDTPEMRALYQGFLKERYATTDALQAAWRASPPIASFDQVTAEAVDARGWDDLRARDWRQFHWWLVRRWLATMHAALRTGDPARPTTVEFYQHPWDGIDIRATLDSISIGNMGYFGLKGRDIAELPARLKFSDMRAYGQGLSIGEFGCKTHPAWANTRDYHETRTEQEQIDLYLAVPHYALGLGACKVHNWCWADGEENIFPWGLVHSNDRVPKRVLSAYRNTALLFKHFAPEYRAPQVWMVVPTRHRAGANGDRVYDAARCCIQGLVEARVDFGVIDEERVADSLPQTARLLLWPAPYCPSDESVEAVDAFVRRGGIAYISGDFSFDADRRRTRTDRLERLAGVRFKEQCFVGLDAPQWTGPLARVTGPGWFGLHWWHGWPAIGVEAAGAQVIARGAEGEPRLVVKRVGAGAVVYTPDVIEAAEDLGALTGIYQAILGFAGAAPVQVQPAIPEVHAFRVPARGGGAAHVLFNANATAHRRITVRTQQHDYALTLGPQKPGLVLEDADGRTLAIEASGEVTRDGVELVESSAHFMLAAEDDRDLAESEQLLVMPVGEGRMRISCARGRGSMMAQVGEIIDGRWTAFETLTPARSRDGFKLEIDPDRAVSLIVIAARDARPGAGSPTARFAASATALGERVARMLVEP